MSDRRTKYAAGLSSLYLPFYEALCNELGEEWQPYFGIRTLAEQDALYAKGRTIPPLGVIVTKAPGGESAHNYGCGTDWTIFQGGAPIWLSKIDPRWKEYQDACDKVGLLWGGEFKSITDLYHNELKISVSWPQVKAVLDSDGMSAAMDFISKSQIT